MVNVKANMCEEPDCKKQPCFNYENETKGIYCAIHKKPDMINVKDSSCLEPGCNTLPVFNYE